MKTAVVPSSMILGNMREKGVQALGIWQTKSRWISGTGSCISRRRCVRAFLGAGTHLTPNNIWVDELSGGAGRIKKMMSGRAQFIES